MKRKIAVQNFVPGLGVGNTIMLTVDEKEEEFLKELLSKYSGRVVQSRPVKIIEEWRMFDLQTKTRLV